MNKKKFLNIIEEVIEVEKDSLNGDEILKELEDWDSLAVMGFIAMVDNHFGITFGADKIGQCKSIQNLVDLLGDRITS